MASCWSARSAAGSLEYGMKFRGIVTFVSGHDRSYVSQKQLRAWQQEGAQQPCQATGLEAESSAFREAQCVVPPDVGSCQPTTNPAVAVQSGLWRSCTLSHTLCPFSSALLSMDHRCCLISSPASSRFTRETTNLADDG